MLFSLIFPNFPIMKNFKYTESLKDTTMNLLPSSTLVNILPYLLYIYIYKYEDIYICVHVCFFERQKASMHYIPTY